jgi:predicted nucleic acid-binding protein
VVVADTDVLIDALEGSVEPQRTRIATLLKSGRLATTAINWFELTAGRRTTVHRLELLHAALGAATVLPVTQGAAEIAAATRRHLERSGQGIGAADYLIAGVCIAHGLPLLTRNLAHFRRVPGLAVASTRG